MRIKQADGPRPSGKGLQGYIMADPIGSLRSSELSEGPTIYCQKFLKRTILRALVSETDGRYHDTVSVVSQFKLPSL